MIVDTLWDNIFRRRQKGERRILDFLAETPIFENLSLRELRTLEKMVYVRRYIAGEPIFHQGDPSLGMYIVKSGAVRIIRQFPEGQARIMATLTIGEFFGELGLIDDAPRSAAAVAQEVTEVIGFFKPDLMALINQTPALGLKILLRVASTLSARLRRTHEELEQLLQTQPSETESREGIRVTY
jgi:CRP-like cAMP-binding protein